MRTFVYSSVGGIVLLVIGCSSTNITTGAGGTGGAAGAATTLSGGASSTGGAATAGTPSATGGSLAAFGGATALASASGGAMTGGGASSMGGAATGGASNPAASATGGAATVVGGASSSGGSNGAATGGSSTHASATGGAGTGGSPGSTVATGGVAATGGAATSSIVTGGAATGGAATGGAATGGAATGGAATGGAATGGAATGGTPSWCQTQTAPTKVAAADFQCVDFDLGLPPSTAWSQTLAKSGTQSVVTTRASSSPNSLMASVPAADSFSTAGTATLTWSNVGSDAIGTVAVAASLSPVTLAGVATPWTGSVSLLCISFGSGQACLDYTYSSESVSFQTAAYTGYIVDWMYVGGAAVRGDCKVTGSLTANIWTRVELRVTKATSTIDVLFGGTSVASCTGAFDADTTFKVAVGPKASASTSFAYTMYFDNILAAVTRAP